MAKIPDYLENIVPIEHVRSVEQLHNSPAIPFIQSSLRPSLDLDVNVTNRSTEAIAPLSKTHFDYMPAPKLTDKSFQDTPAPKTVEIPIKPPPGFYPPGKDQAQDDKDNKDIPDELKGGSDNSKVQQDQNKDDADYQPPISSGGEGEGGYEFGGGEKGGGGIIWGLDRVEESNARIGATQSQRLFSSESSAASSAALRLKNKW